MSAWLWLALAILATAAGQLLFKQASVRRARALTLLAIVSFCVAPAAAYMALRDLDLATVYVSTVLSQLLVVLASLLWFGEHYRRRQWLGLALIVAGVLVFNVPNL